jgi:transposase
MAMWQLRAGLQYNQSFQVKKVAPVLKDIFKQILLLAAEGLVSLKEVYIDGTKIEANATGTPLYGAMQ